LYVLPGPEISLRVAADDASAVLPSTFPIATRETVQVMQRLLPRLEHIYVVSGIGVSDRSYMDVIRGVIDGMSLDLQVHYLIGPTTEELVKALDESPPNSALLLGHYDKDRTGRTGLGTINFGNLVDRPSFVMIGNLFGTGVVGGSVARAELYAQATSELIRLQLGKEASGAEPIVTTYQFDAAQLNRWKIDRSLLPDGARILFERPSLITEYGWHMV
jgi:hypothetical protein